MIEEFRIIYHNNKTDKVVPFLQKLTTKEKKELTKELKLLIEHKNKSNKNRDILVAVALVCCTKSQFNSYIDRLWEWTWRRDNNFSQLIDDVLAWQCPNWLSEHYNKRAEDDWGTLLSYHNLLKWQQKGYLNSSSTLIAKVLAQSVSGWDVENNKNLYKPEVFDLDPITLDEHIWTLFQCDTNVFTDIWQQAFKELTDKGRINRLRVLRECLLTVNVGFKNYVAGWFTDLFVFMKPTEDELLQIQDELFMSFSSKYSKITNKSLSQIKKIASCKNFKVDDFISELPLLLTSETKSIVISTLAILEKAAKIHADKRELICTELSITFLNKDEAIQTKAAKLITQYGNVSSIKLKEALHIYNDSVLMSVKEILKDYLDNAIHPQNVALEQDEDFSEIQIIDDNLLITVPQTTDDLIFFLLQLFENGEPYQIDLLPATLIRLTKEINETNISQLELPLQKAYEICLSRPFHHMFIYDTKEFEKTYFWGRGAYYNLAALFFVQCCQHLATVHPLHAAFINEIHKSAIEKDKKQAKDTKGRLFQYDRQITRLQDWIFAEYPIFKAYHEVMMQALTFIEKNIQLPLLSTPTHYPCWINPEILADRLFLYQQAGQTPNLMDMQLALARIAPESIPILTALITEKTTAKYKEDILNFYLENETDTEKEKSLLAIFTKEKIQCSLSNIKAYTNRHSWKIAEDKKIDSTYTERFTTNISIAQSPWIEEKESHYACVSDQLRLCIGTQDVKNFIYSYPSIPEIPFGMIVKDRFEFAQIPDAEFRDFLTAAIAALFDLKVEARGLTSLFLACSILCSEKTIRNYATEIWIERTTTGLLDNSLFGTDIGKLEKTEWAPLKRLTDEIMDRMINISPRHNKALETMIVAILSQIEKPITNLKKMLEIYSELLSLNNSKADLDKIPQLKQWLEKSSLKKIVKQILG